jgi:glyoxylase-like metal-dependent hydrolase (beta-lactamase superfamily II)
MKIKRLVVGEIATNCYLVASEKELMIIDPGGEAKEVLNLIGKIPAKAKYIINTHYHFDHSLGNEKLKRTTKAKILIHEAEKGRVDFSVDQWLADNDKIVVGNHEFKVALTPGHSQGSICLFANKCVFTGDTLFKDGIGRTDLPGGSSEDLRQSLEKLAKLIKPGTTVYPGHGEPFEYQEGMIKGLIEMFFG